MEAFPRRCPSCSKSKNRNCGTSVIKQGLVKQDCKGQKNKNSPTTYSNEMLRSYPTDYELHGNGECLHMMSQTTANFASLHLLMEKLNIIGSSEAKFLMKDFAQPGNVLYTVLVSKFFVKQSQRSEMCSKISIEEK